MFETMRKSWRVAAVTVVALGTLAAVAHAQQAGPGSGLGFGGPGRGMHGRGMGQMGPMARLGLPLGRLDLTDAQREQVRAIVQNHQDQMRQLGERTRDARQALRQASEAEAFDENAVRAASTGLSTVMADGAVLRAKMRAEVMQVLTAEQRAKAAELRTQSEQRMQQRQERMKQRMQDRQQRLQKPQGGAV